MGSNSVFSGISQTMVPSWRYRLTVTSFSRRATTIWRLRTFRGSMHRDEVTVEDAGVLHTHAGYLQQVVRPRLKQRGIDLQPGLKILLGEDRPTGGDPTDERQAHLLADGIFELDTPGCARYQGDDAFAGKGPQMPLRRHSQT